MLGLLQITLVDPIIFEAESFEIPEPESPDDNHGHSHQGWGPEDGFERTFYTLISNVFAATGFAAVLLALMNLLALRNQGLTPQSNGLTQGVLWGLGGFAAVFLAPAIGLPPEIPGIEAPPIESRQTWWFLTVACVAFGIGLVAFAGGVKKLLGLVLVSIPFIVGAPAHEGPMFTHPDPAVVAALTNLHQSFIVASGVVNLVFWIALGIVTAMGFKRWLCPNQDIKTH